MTNSKIEFFKFINGDLTAGQFEEWVHDNHDLKRILGKDHYTDLVSFDFSSRVLRLYVETLVEKFFGWRDYEEWRTIKLLEETSSGEIEIVLATRKMRELYLEQKEKIGAPLISASLAIGYASELDNLPTEDQYHLWNSAALEKHLAQTEKHNQRICDDVNKELCKIQNLKNTVQSDRE